MGFIHDHKAPAIWLPESQYLQQEISTNIDQVGQGPRGFFWRVEVVERSLQKIFKG